MNGSKKEDLAKVVKELTLLLDEGHDYLDNLLKEYTLSFIGFFFVISHHISARMYLYKWKDKTIKKLSKHLGNSRYISHFKYPKTTKVNKSKIDSEFIKNYTTKFDSHLNALQNIIWNISEEDVARDNSISRQLVLDIEKGTLRYKKLKQIEVSTDTQPIKLLRLLLVQKGKILEYKTIARELNINAYNINEDNKSLARDVGYIRRDLIKILFKAGVKKHELSQLIITQKNVGYKIT